jgi:hypothetical protein
MLLDGIFCRVACFGGSLARQEAKTGRIFLKNIFIGLSTWYIYSSVGLGRGRHVVIMFIGAM